jgi:site-specific recombinase XerD
MSTELVDPMASVRAYLAAEKSSSTRRGYKSDWADFSAWCEGTSESPLPATPIAVAKYLSQLADGCKKVSTIERRVAAIRYAHKSAGHEPPTNAEGVKAVMRGIRRTKGRKRTKKAPATAELIAKLLNFFPETLRGIRDRAIVLVAFAAALRRSELVDLEVNDVEWRQKGIILHIRRSKTDQEGRGAEIPIPRGNRLKPVDALEAWLNTSGITEGPIFREVDRHGRVGTQALSGRSVARIVKRAIKSLGLDEKIYSGHSMRAGFVTTSLENGVDVLKIMGITRHTDVNTLREYDRRDSGFDDHAGGGFL